MEAAIPASLSVLFPAAWARARAALAMAVPEAAATAARAFLLALVGGVLFWPPPPPRPEGVATLAAFFLGGVAFLALAAAAAADEALLLNLTSESELSVLEDWEEESESESSSEEETLDERVWRFGGGLAGFFLSAAEADAFGLPAAVVPALLLLGPFF